MHVSHPDMPVDNPHPSQFLSCVLLEPVTWLPWAAVPSTLILLLPLSDALTIVCQVNCCIKNSICFTTLLKAESDQKHSNYKGTKRERQSSFELNPIWTILSWRALIIHCLCICAEHARSEFHIIKKALHRLHTSWQL